MKLVKTIATLMLLYAPCVSSAKEDGNPTNETTGQDWHLSSVTHTLTNANATAEARQLYGALWSLYGKKALSATMACVDWNIREAYNVRVWTGKYPALNVFDFINIHVSKDVNPNGWIDYSDNQAVVKWAKEGGIVGCMWHWQMKANNGTDYTCTPGDMPGETSFDPSCVDRPGSTAYKQLVRDIDQVAGYLKKMQKQHIPVLWRPLHEGAGNTYEYDGGKAWFWWGAKGADCYKKLWRFMYNRLVVYHKLNNLIWIWNSQMGDSDWYPGDDVVDIVGRDNYGAQQQTLAQNYRQLCQEYPSKLVTLAECGSSDKTQMPAWSEIWQEGAHWSWFMPWYDYDYDYGKSGSHKYADSQWWQDAFGSGSVVDRDQMKALLAEYAKKSR